MKDFELGKSRAEVYSVEGSVIQCGNDKTVNISTSVHTDSQTSSTVHVNSRTSVSTILWLMCDNVERRFEIDGNIPVRVGHHVKIWFIKNISANLSYGVVLINHTTGQSFRLHASTMRISEILQLEQKPTGCALKSAIVVGCLICSILTALVNPALGIVLFLVSVALFAGGWAQWIGAKKELLKQIDSIIDSKLE